MLELLSDSITLIANQTQSNLGILAKILVLVWGIFAINLIVGKRLLLLGIRPRHFSGLPGIVFAPFLHANFDHIFFNSIPLMVFANFILINGIPAFLTITALIMLISGLLVWCFATPGLHVGASGVITGYWSYLLTKAYWQSSPTTVILAGICVVYFAGILWSIFPGKKQVSWQSHLFGLIAGAGVAYYY